MKRIYSFIIMVALLITAFAISGCFPPNYSKEQAKKIVSEHKPEALAWFSKNMPAAKPDAECEAYKTELDLFGAIKGSYKVIGKSYDYVFDYNTKNMYVGEGYEETCALVKAAILKEFNYSAKETKVSFHGYSFKLKNENDKLSKRMPIDQPKEISTKLLKLIPAKISPQEFAQRVLAPDTNEVFNFYIDVYRDSFPKYEPEKQAKFKNLGLIMCFIPVDIEKDAQTVYKKYYSVKGVEEYVCHLAKVEDGFYAGYETKWSPKLEDKAKVTKKTSKQFLLEIPKTARPIFFSKEKKMLVHSFKNPKGNLIENIIADKHTASVPGMAGFKQHGLELVVKDEYAHSNSATSVSLVGGAYDVKALGFFNFDYWRLKYFHD